MSLNMQTERLRPLPTRTDEVWQGGAIRFDVRVGALDGASGCLWVSPATGKVHIGEIGPDGSVTPAGVVATLVEFATGPNLAHGRPGRIEVSDPAHAAAVRAVVEPLGIAVEVVDALPAVRAVERELSAEMGAVSEMAGEHDAPPPPLTDDPAVTPALLAGLAGAAVAFDKAKPWKRFGPTEILQVVAPAVEKPLRFAHVMGGGGEQFGLAFFPTKAAFQKMFAGPDPIAQAAQQPMVSVALDDADGLPDGDVATWKRLKLPAAKRGRTAVYPFPVRYYRGVWTRPTATELATMEGLLRAVAAVAEGRFEGDGPLVVPVTTAAGPVTYTLKRVTVTDAFATGAGADAGTGAGRAGGGMMSPQKALDTIASSIIDDAFAPLPADATPARRTAVTRLQAALKATGTKRMGLALEAAAADPTYADAFNLIGVAAASPKAAAEAFRRAAEHAAPAEANARVRAAIGLALAESSLGHAEAALRLLQDVTALFETNPLAARMMGLKGR